MSDPTEMRKTYKCKEYAAMAWARRQGIKGNGGGWVRVEGRLMQGWREVADYLIRTGRLTVDCACSTRYSDETDIEVQRRRKLCGRCPASIQV